jgi:hypothetical protein
MEHEAVKAGDLLASADASGITIRLDGSDLRLSAISKPDDEVLAMLRAHKAEIVSHLQQESCGLDAEDWLAFFDERAGIAEYDGQQTRKQAEATAGECCVIEWLNRHPEPSDPDRCAGCNKPGSQCLVVPFLAGDGSHTWLHPECWEAWHQARRREAVAALDRLGINAG